MAGIDLNALTKAERRRVLDESAVSVVAPVFGWGTLLYLSLSLAHVFVLTREQWRWMTPLALLTALVFGTGYGAQRVKPASAHRAHLWITFGATLALLNSTVHLIVQDAPLQVTNLMLTVIGSGLLCLRTRAFVMVVVLSLVGYALGVAFAREASSEWMHMGFALTTTIGLASVLLIHRQRTTLRLVLSTRRLEANQARLTDALEDARVELEQRQRVEQELRELGQELEVRVERRARELAESRAQLAIESQERQAAEDALSRQREELDRARRLETVGLLAGGIAHDFNNTLTVVMACAELAAERAPESRPLMEQIDKAASQASRLTRQLLAFGRRQLMEPKPTSLNDILRNNEALLSRMLGDHIQLDLSLSEGLNLAQIDAGQLEQVFANLAINARDAMPEGGTLTISTRNVTVPHNDPHAVEPGRYVCCSIRDTGTGMSEEVRSRIFEPYFTTKDHLGTGLGLASVHGIIKQSRGEIRVDSTPDRGTTFTIWLPVAKAKPEVESPHVLSQSHRIETGGSVLLVEDNPAIRELMRESLTNAGFEVIAVADGERALQQLEQTSQRVDVVVSDVLMPRMSGTELFEVLEERFPELRVLFISAYAPEHFEHRALRSASILQKPFPPSVLVDRVRTLVSGKLAAEATSSRSAG